MDRSKQINNKRPIISCSMFQPTPSELPPSNHDKSSSQIIDARFVEAIFLIGFLPGVTRENVCFYDSGASINVVAETSVVNFHNKFLNPDTESQCLYGLSGKKSLGAKYDIILPIRHSKKSIAISAISTDQILPPTPMQHFDCLVQNLKKHAPKHVQDLKVWSSFGGPIDILLGLPLLKYHPKPIFTLEKGNPPGLSIFQTQLMPYHEKYTYTIGGPYSILEMYHPEMISTISNMKYALAAFLQNKEIPKNINNMTEIPNTFSKESVSSSSLPDVNDSKQAAPNDQTKFEVKSNHSSVIEPTCIKSEKVNTSDVLNDKSENIIISDSLNNVSTTNTTQISHQSDISVNKSLNNKRQHLIDLFSNVPFEIDLHTESNNTLKFPLPNKHATESKLVDEKPNFLFGENLTSNIVRPNEENENKAIHAADNYLKQKKDYLFDKDLMKDIYFMMNPTFYNNKCISCSNCSICKRLETDIKLQSITNQEEYHIRNSLLFDEDKGRFIAKLPFIKNPYTHLIGNYNEVCKRFRRTLKTIRKQDIEPLQKSFQKLVDLNFIIPFDDLSQEDKDLINSKPVQYYIPWSVAYKLTSLSTPVRTCSDASAKTKSGFSLNDCLAKGKPDLDFLCIATQFRLGKVALICDLSKFYNSIILHKEHLNFQNTIWSDDFNPEGPLKRYIIATVMYGLKSSSRQLEHAIELIADKTTTMPHVQHFLKKCRYVDDGLSSCPDYQTAEQLIKDTDKILHENGFSVKGWLMSKTEPDSKLVDDGICSVSGYLYFVKQDIIQIRIQPFNFDDVKKKGRIISTSTFTEGSITELNDFVPINLTLRQACRTTATFFDEIGLACPWVLKSKILYRKCCRFIDGIHWDKPLPSEYRSQYVDIFYDMMEIGKFKFQRFQMPENIDQNKRRLLCFTDASFDGLFQCVYLSYPDEDGIYHSQILLAKSQIAKENVTIPNLELESLAHGATLLHRAQKLVGTYHDSYLFCDSTISLFWLRKDPSNLSLYQRNRAIRITNLVDRQNIYHVRSEANCADLGTRPCTVDEVKPDSQYQTGHPFMANLQQAIKNKIITHISNLSVNEKVVEKSMDGLSRSLDMPDDYFHKIVAIGYGGNSKPTYMSISQKDHVLSQFYENELDEFSRLRRISVEEFNDSVDDTELTYKIYDTPDTIDCVMAILSSNSPLANSSTANKIKKPEENSSSNLIKQYNTRSKQNISNLYDKYPQLKQKIKIDLSKTDRVNLSSNLLKDKYDSIEENLGNANHQPVIDLFDNQQPYDDDKNNNIQSDNIQQSCNINDTQDSGYDSQQLDNNVDVYDYGHSQQLYDEVDTYDTGYDNQQLYDEIDTQNHILDTQLMYNNDVDQNNDNIQAFNAPELQIPNNIDSNINESNHIPSLNDNQLSENSNQIYNLQNIDDDMEEPDLPIGYGTVYNIEEVEKRFKTGNYILNPLKYGWYMSVEIVALFYYILDVKIKKRTTQMPFPAKDIENFALGFQKTHIFRRTQSTANNNKKSLLDVYHDVNTRNHYRYLAIYYFLKKASSEAFEHISKKSLKLHSRKEHGLSLSRIKHAQLVEVCSFMENLSPTDFRIQSKILYLDRFSPVTISIMIHMHERASQHAGIHKTQSILNKMMQVFRGGPILRKIIEGCIPCRIKNKKKHFNTLGPLTSRLTFLPVGTYLALDVSGPYKILRGMKKMDTRGSKKQMKVWILHSICTITFYNQVQILMDYSAAEFANAYGRIATQTGYAKKVFIDSSSSELKGMEYQFLVADFKRLLFTHFNTEVVLCGTGGNSHSRHGVIERAIGVFKTFLQQFLLESEDYHYTRFYTLILAICSTMNNWPIGCKLRRSKSILAELITPRSFFCGIASPDRFPIGLPEFVSREDSLNNIQHLSQKFAEFYNMHMGCYLLKDANHGDSDPPLRPNDLVLFQHTSGNKMGINWRIGRITETEQDGDGDTRIAIIQYSNHNEIYYPLEKDERIRSIQFYNRPQNLFLRHFTRKGTHTLIKLETFDDKKDREVWDYFMSLK